MFSPFTDVIHKRMGNTNFYSMFNEEPQVLVVMNLNEIKPFVKAKSRAFSMSSLGVCESTLDCCQQLYSLTAASNGKSGIKSVSTMSGPECGNVGGVSAGVASTGG